MEDRATLSEDGLNFPLHVLGNLSAGKSLPRPLPPQGLQPRKKASEQGEGEGTRRAGAVGQMADDDTADGEGRHAISASVWHSNKQFVLHHSGKETGKLRRRRSRIGETATEVPTKFFVRRLAV